MKTTLKIRRVLGVCSALFSNVAFAQSSARIEPERFAEAVRRAISELLGQMVDIPGKNYKMCKYEVTQALWMAIMGDNPSYFKGPNRPVESISWNDCQKFLEKLNANPDVKKTGLVFRLPTEEEWEYACRAGSSGDYCKMTDGSEITEETLGTVAWYDDNSNKETHPVGQKQPNAFGLYDMHGNVWEWTSTAVGGFRVNRGGCWNFSAVNCTCGLRCRDSPDDRYDLLGLRLVASAGRGSGSGLRQKP